MIATEIFETDDCLRCHHHYKEMISDPDGFGTETGIYCSKAENILNDEDEHRLVCSDFHVKTAPVPTWCPLIISNYRKLMLRGHFALCDEETKNIICWAVSILKALETNKFNDFLYETAWRPNATERDECLINLAAIRAYNRARRMETHTHLLDNKEDRDIVWTASELKYSDGDFEKYITEYIESFNQVKAEAKENHYRPILKPELAIPIIYWLADMMAHEGLAVTGSINFIVNEDGVVKAAELRYTTSPGWEVLDMDSDKKRAFLLIKRILKEFFGVKTFRLYVDNKQIPLNKKL